MPVFRHTNESVNEMLNKTGARLEGDFINVDTLFGYRCNKHDDVVQYVYHSNYVKGFTCRFCKEENKIKREHDNIRQKLEDKGCVLAFIDYHANKYPCVNFICKKHADMGMQRNGADSFIRNRTGCKYCKHDLHCQKMIIKIRVEFAKRDWTLLSTEYKHRRHPLEFICNKHPEKVLKIQWNAYVSKQSNSYICKDCHKKALSKYNLKYIHEEDGRYTVRINTTGIKKRFGGYKTKQAAITARNKACIELGILDKVLS